PAGLTSTDTLKEVNVYFGDISIPPAINPLRFTRPDSKQMPNVLSVKLDSKDDSALINQVYSYLKGPISLPEFSASASATAKVSAVLSVRTPIGAPAIDHIECVWNESVYRSFIHSCHTVERRMSEEAFKARYELKEKSHTLPLRREMMKRLD